MKQTGASPTITFRIPGAWSHPKELLERLPKGFRLSPETLLLPDGTELKFTPMPPDEQFAGVFLSACHRPPTDDERAVLDRYTVNVGLSGPGGSLESVLAMMQAAAAVVKAGGAGVFIDNCALAHGRRDWLAMTEDAGPDAVSFAFVAIVRRPRELSTVGMRVMGFPDLWMPASEVDERGEMLVRIIRSLFAADRPTDVGRWLADEIGPCFQVVANESDKFETESVLHNPCGRLKIVSLKEIAEGN